MSESDTQDLVSKLIARNQTLFLTNVFLHLETQGLFRCLLVNQVWKMFLQEYIFKSRAVGLRLLSKAWREFDPEHSVDTLSGSITDLSGDDERDEYMASYTNGDFDLVREDGIRSLVGESDSDYIRHVTSSRVQMGEHLVSIEKFGTDYSNRVVTVIIIKRRSDLKSIFRYKVKNQFSSYFLDKSAFISDGDILKHITFDSNCDLIQENDKDLSNDQVNIHNKHSLGDLQVVHDKFLVFTDKCSPFLLHILDSSLDTWRTITVYNEADHNGRTGHTGQVVDVSKVCAHLIILLRNSLSVIKDFVNDNSRSQLRHVGSSTDHYVCMRSNRNVLAVMDQKNCVLLFSIQDVLAAESAPLVSPYLRLELPLPLCQWTTPCLALTSASLLAAMKGSSILHRFTVWNDSSCNGDNISDRLTNVE